jgi:hypothetical protein
VLLLGVDEEMLLSQPRQASELPTLVDQADDGDRPSITEVNGTVARFEMAYNPNPRERFVFGPPLWQRLPSLIFLGFSIAVGCVVLGASFGASSNSVMFRWVTDRPGAMPLSLIIFLCALATVVRAGLRGVIITREGVEARYLLAMGVPRIRKWSWVQIDRLVVDDEGVLLELWDGTYERLPEVKDTKEMASLLERVALGRGRQVTRLPGKEKREKNAA